MNGLLTFCSKLEQTNHGNGAGDNIADRANRGRDREISSTIFIHNIGQRGRKDYLNTHYLDQFISPSFRFADSGDIFDPSN